jgi:hypothetical protein
MRRMLEAGRLRVRVLIRLLMHFDLPEPPNRVMTLGLVQPLIEMSTRRYLWGKARLAHKAGNRTALYVRTVLTVWAPRYVTTL